MNIFKAIRMLNDYSSLEKEIEELKGKKWELECNVHIWESKLKWCELFNRDSSYIILKERTELLDSKLKESNANLQHIKNSYEELSEEYGELKAKYINLLASIKIKGFDIKQIK